MSLFYFLILFIFIFTGISLVVLLGDLPNFRGTALHKLNILLVDRFVKWVVLHFTKFDVIVFNGYLTSEASKARISWLSGWIIPAFYLVVISKCLAFFFEYTYPQIVELESISNPDFDWSWRYNCVMLPAMLLNYTSFILAVFSDPGYIDPIDDEMKLKSLKAQREFPMDELIFYRTRCTTCLTNKPARSKHCSSCNKCVLMFDHHCVWLNNDVAYYTFRWFFLFLVSMCFILLYGGYLCYYCLYLYLAETGDLPDSIRLAPLITKYWSLIKRTTFTNEVSGIMFLLCLFLFPLVSFFLGETIKSVYLGVTTNEIAKWDYINELVKNELLYRFVSRDGTEIVFLVIGERLPNGNIRFLKLGNREPFTCNTGGTLDRIKDWDDMDNIYDRGFWINLKQKLFPQKF